MEKVISIMRDPEAGDEFSVVSPEIAEIFRTDRALHDQTAREWTRKYYHNFSAQPMNIQ